MAVRDVADALLLRRWALKFLAGREATPPAGCSETGYNLFLEAERCAVPLLRHVGSLSSTAFPEDVSIRLTRRAGVEQERIESARDQLATIREIAREHGGRVALLKGTAAATGGDTAVDLVDIDLLVEPDQARAFAAALDRRGYRPIEGSTPRHLAERSNGGAVSIEIHTTLSEDGTPTPEAVWNGLRPLDDLPPLCRLGAADHLWHMLTHIAIDHPNRQAHLRELLLVAGAVDECAPEEMADVERRIAGHAQRETLGRTLVASRDLFAGVDSQTAVAAKVYAVRRVLRSVRLPRILGPYVYDWAFALFFGKAARRRLWNRIWQPSLEPSRFGPLRWLETKAGRIGTVMRRVLRLGRAALAIAVAIPAAAAARRTAAVAVRALAARQPPESA